MHSSGLCQPHKHATVESWLFKSRFEWSGLFRKKTWINCADIGIISVHGHATKCIIEDNHDQCTHGINIMYATTFETTIWVFTKSFTSSHTNIFCVVVCIPWDWIYIWLNELQKKRDLKKWMYNFLIYPDILWNTREYIYWESKFIGKSVIIC